MFERLKTMFSQNHEPEEESVSREELGQWITTKEKKYYGDAVRKIDQKKQGILRLITETEKHITDLEGAELQNKKIPKRALQLMDGNRESYIKKTRDFIKNLDTDFEDLESVKDFLSQFQKQLELLNKNNIKSYMVLQEFLANETGKIARDIKGMEKIVRELEEILKTSGLEKITSMRAMIEKLDEKTILKSQIEKRLGKEREELEAEKKQKISITERVKELQKSEEYTSFESLKKERDEIIQRLKKQEDRLIQLFSGLESGLKKYGRIALDEASVVSYQKNPPRALYEDEELKILTILKNLRKNIDDGTIDMKDKKKTKTLETIEKLDKGFFSDYLFEYNELKHAKKIKDEKIAKNTVMHDYNELDYMLNHLNQKIDAAERNIHNTEKACEKTDLQELENELINMAEQAFQVKLSIS